MKIDLVIVNFFSGRKKVITFFSQKKDLVSVLDKIGNSYSESVLVAYHEGQEVLSHRPIKMMKEKEKVQAGNMDLFEFLIRWRIFFGEQHMPDLDLPEKKIVESVNEEVSPEDLIPHRSKFVEIVPDSFFS